VPLRVAGKKLESGDIVDNADYLTRDAALEDVLARDAGIERTPIMIEHRSLRVALIEGCSVGANIAGLLINHISELAAHSLTQEKEMGLLPAYDETMADYYEQLRTGA
jgi:hypothetical protein